MIYEPKITHFVLFYKKRKAGESIRQPVPIYVLDVYPMKPLGFGYAIEGLTDDGAYHYVLCQAEAGSNAECWQEFASEPKETNLNA